RTGAVARVSVFPVKLIVELDRILELALAIKLCRLLARLGHLGVLLFDFLVPPARLTPGFAPADCRGAGRLLAILLDARGDEVLQLLTPFRGQASVNLQADGQAVEDL